MRKVCFLFIICLFSVSTVLLSIPVFAQSPQNVSVSVTVAPKTTDFQFAFASTDGKTNVPQNTVLSYEITYGAQASAGLNTATTLVADFNDDMAPGGSHVLDYVPGSAGNAYGAAVPVVDLVNRKITWTIAALPPGTTNQTVAFQLRTNSNYTGDSTISFTTRAQMSNQYISMPDQTVIQAYTYDSSLVPTPTPTSAQAPTPTASIPTPILPIGVTVAPTSRPAPIGTGILPVILSIDFINITPSGATISIRTSVPVKNTLSYGIAPNSLLERVQTENYLLSESIVLTNLKSDTVYYFRVTSTDRNGNSVQSEIYTFKTAKDISTPFFIEEGALSIESNGVKVYSKIVNRESAPGFVLLTENSDFTLLFTPKNPVNYKSFTMVLKSNGAPDKIINLQLKNGQIYIADAKTGSAGKYEIFLKAQDENGNLTEQKVIDLKVSPRLGVFEKGSSNPIGDARVFLYYFNTRTGKFEPVSKERFAITNNPLFTDASGQVNLALPYGRYRVDASAFSYDKVSVDFTLGPGINDGFPQVMLSKNPFNILNILLFIKDWLNDLLLQMSGFLYSSIGNIRIFNTVAIIVTAATALISTLFFLLRTHINFKHLPLFFLFGLHMALNKDIGKYIFGVIKDKSDLPITRAIIQLIDMKTGEVLAHTISNKKGRFHIQNTQSKQDLKLVIGKDGYKETESVLGIDDLPPEGLEIKLDYGGHRSGNLGRGGLELIEHIGGSLFETTLILSIILEIFFLANFGIVRTLPFFALSLLNILLWLFYIRH